MPMDKQQQQQQQHRKTKHVAFRHHERHIEPRTPLEKKRANFQYSLWYHKTFRTQQDPPTTPEDSVLQRIAQLKDPEDSNAKMLWYREKRRESASV